MATYFVNATYHPVGAPRREADFIVSDFRVDPDHHEFLMLLRMRVSTGFGWKEVSKIILTCVSKLKD